ncbi:MAG: hypothetical protein COS41_01890 [Elusimicrobia bacterium CG03_land_8_20_14_0_80_50_18]|nr:MAG: hypothetical protein COS41_01890 [Elusimicrobia bacterium CG03_land_8_20_14_0_80_50_18]
MTRLFSSIGEFVILIPLMKKNNSHSQSADILRVSAILFMPLSLAWLALVSFKFYQYHPVSLTLSYLFRLQGEFSLPVFLSLIPGYIAAIAAAAAVTLAAFFTGTSFFSLVKMKFNDKYENMLFSSAAGFGIIAYMTLLIGYLGALYRVFFYIIFTAFSLAAIVKIRSLNRAWPPPGRSSKITMLEKIMIAMLFMLALFNLMMSFTPEMFYDSLNYHVGAPNYFIQNHKVMPLPYKILSNFPLTVSMIFTAGMLLKDVMAPKLLNFMFGILIALGIIHFSLRRFGNRLTGIIGAVVFYFTPTIMFRSWLASNDIGLTLFIFFSLYALINYTEETKRNFQWLLTAAVLSGFALGSKYTAVFFIAPLALVLVIHGFFMKQALKKIFKSAAIFGFATLAVASPWFIRNYINSGNPVHPLMTDFFDIKYPYDVSASTEFDYHNPLTQISKITSLFTLPWNMSIKGGGRGTRYSSPDYYMSGVIFLVFLPLLFFFRLKNNALIIHLLVFFLCSYALWAIAPNTKFKYFSPAIPGAALLAGYVVCAATRENQLLKNIFGFSVIILAMSNFLFMAPLAVYTYQPLSLLTGAVSRDQYLSESRPGYPYPSYKVYQYANRTLPEDDVKILIFGDAKCLYIKRPFVAFSVEGLNPLIEYLRNGADADDVYNNLILDEFTHLIVNVPEGIRTAGYGNFYFNGEDILKLRAFWKKYITELYQYKGVYLYKVDEVKKRVAAPYNSVEGAFRTYRLNQIIGSLKNSKWEGALTGLAELLDRNIADHWIFYLTAVCHHNLQNYPEALKYANMAYKAEPQDEYRELLKAIRKAQAG